RCPRPRSKRPSSSSRRRCSPPPRTSASNTRPSFATRSAISSVSSTRPSPPAAEPPVYPASPRFAGKGCYPRPLPIPCACCPRILKWEVPRVALDRQSIEKKDFPVGRRGYDPDAGDTHLTALADEVDELKRSSRRRTETLASSASEQVRAIVEAAETSAADIQRQAEEEA